MAREDVTHNWNDGSRAGEPGDAATGTVLDYLWLDQGLDDGMGRAADAAESGAQEAMAACTEKQPEHAPGTPCLQSTLENYSRWLDSIAAN